MLFELGGKRKRVIQVIYVFLALLLAVGLVGLGIGGSANGGIFDALGLTDSSSDGSSQFDSEIDNANDALAKNPEDTAALLKLARYQYLKGQQSLDTDEAGNVSITEDTTASWEDATDAWERYLDSLPKGQKVNDDVAGLITQAYSGLAQTEDDPQVFTRLFANGAEAAAVVAEARPSVNAWLQAAAFAYYSGDTKKGEAAGKKALAEANEADRKAVSAQLKQFEKQGEAIAKQLKATGPTEEDLENPLAPLGGSTGSGAGAIPTTPTP
jgi:hypothetical protein